MKFIIGKKEYMTKIFDEKGLSFPVTLISTNPITLTQIKDKKKDGYSAFQFGYGERKEKKTNKAQKGHTKELGNFWGFKEICLKEDDSSMKLGDKIGVEAFSLGDKVTITAVSKGKGFQGVVKRHGFGGGRRTHGQKHSEREPGAIGGGARAGGRVAKGMRMAGRMGGDRITVKNLKVLGVNKEENYILLGGAVPGKRGTIIEIKG